MKAVGIAIACLVMLCLSRFSIADSLRLDWTQGDYATFELTGRTLTGQARLSDGASMVEEFRFSADIYDLDLEETFTADRAPYFTFFCKDNKPCVHNSSYNCECRDQYCGCRAGSPNDFTSDSTHASITCPRDSTEECQAFVSAMRAAASPQQNHPAELVAPERQPAQLRATTASSSIGTSDSPEASAVMDLHKLLASLNALSGDASTQANNGALKSLLNSINTGRTGRGGQPRARVTYAAFAQAAGFDANGAWGAGSAADLNSAVGAAETNCSNGGQNLCGDEGYCALKPGLWGAWASDLLVSGNSAFVCNVESEGVARQQAQAWCGASCKVLWSGAGQ